MILYHGTNSRVWRKIEEGRGIEPRAMTYVEGNWDKHPSHRMCVYLTDCYALYFAAMSCKEDGDRPVVVEVEVEQDKLLPDEDFMEQATRKARPDGCPKEMADATEWFRERLQALPDFAQNSLDGLGTVAHYGRVTRDRVKRAFMADKVVDAIFLCDPAIVLMNHTMLGEHYRELHKQLFDGPSPITGVVIDGAV